MIYFKNLYLHIPFCKKKCEFCNFFSASIDDVHIKRLYTQSLLRELDKYVHNLEHASLDTVYFGGGTPVLLEIDNLRQIMSRLKKFISSKTEITIELNPANLIYIDELLDLGFNRFSVGIQSFNKKQLIAIDRDFNLDFILKKLETFKQYQKKDKRLEQKLILSLDFMFGLPSETMNDIKQNIDFIKKLKPEHISYYMFTVHKNYNWRLPQPTEDTITNMFYYIKRNLEILKYRHYEISNYAKPKNYSRHNLNYWQGKSYLALGAGAHSFDGNKRWWNNKNLYKYNEGKFIEDYELLTPYQHKIEEIMLGLRTLDIGVKKELIKNKITPKIEKMLMSYMSTKGEKFYKIRPEFLHMIDLIEEELVI